MSRRLAVTRFLAAAPSGDASARQDPKVRENRDLGRHELISCTDLSEDRVGNFARRLEYVNGPVQAVEREGAAGHGSLARGRPADGRSDPEEARS